MTAAITAAAGHGDVTPLSEVGPAVISHTAYSQAAVYHTAILVGQHEVHTGLVSVTHSVARCTADAAVLVADMKAAQLTAEQHCL